MAHGGIAPSSNEYPTTNVIAGRPVKMEGLPTPHYQNNFQLSVGFFYPSHGILISSGDNPMFLLENNYLAHPMLICIKNAYVSCFFYNFWESGYGLFK